MSKHSRFFEPQPQSTWCNGCNIFENMGVGEGWDCSKMPSRGSCTALGTGEYSGLFIDWNYYKYVSYITCYICLNTAGFLRHNLNPPDAMAATFMKIWELMRDEIVPKCPQGVVVLPSEQVSMVGLFIVWNYNNYVSYITYYIFQNTAGFLRHNLNPPDANGCNLWKYWSWWGMRWFQNAPKGWLYHHGNRWGWWFCA